MIACVDLIDTYTTTVHVALVITHPFVLETCWRLPRLLGDHYNYNILQNQMACTANNERLAFCIMVGEWDIAKYKKTCIAVIRAQEIRTQHSLHNSNSL